MKINFLLLIVVSSMTLQTFSQAETDSTNNFDHRVLPFAFYLPQTNFGLGGLGIFSFKINKESKNRDSQILYSAAYTLENQLLLYFPYEFYFKNNNSRIIGELGYYRYNYRFYGLGNESLEENKEKYNVNFPRIYMQYFNRVYGAHFLGVGVKFDYFDMIKLEEDGILVQDNILGNQGGTTLLGNINYLFDTRDNIAFPSNGSFLEIDFDFGSKDLLSDYSFSKLTVDGRHFHEIRENLILAGHLYYSTASEGTPFYQLPKISSQSLARGIADRRYIDKQLINVQTELRFPIYKKFHGATFISESNIGKKINSTSLKLSGGAGLRYVVNEKQNTRIRLDLGVGKKSFNFYFTIKEAF